MRPTTGDLSLYAKHIAGRLSELSGVYVDDLIEAESEEFSNFTKQTGQRVDAESREIGKAKFMGMEFNQKRQVFRTMHARMYL